MKLVYQIVFARKTWNTIGSVEVDALSFKEGEEILNDLIHEHYAIPIELDNANLISSRTYAEYSLIPSIEAI